MTKKTFSYFIMFILLLSTISALQISKGEEVIISEIVDENLFAAGGSISIEEQVNGDLTAFGGSISVNSPINGHSMTCGGSISINSPVSDGAHACGGSVSINSPITGDLLSGGGSISINSDVNGDVRIGGGDININGKVSGDILAGGGSININGPVSGDVAIAAGELTINSVVDGDVTIKAGKFKLGKGALIKENLKYTVKEKATFKEEQIQGIITKEEVTKKVLSLTGEIVFAILGFISLFLFGLIFVLAAPNFSNSLSSNIKSHFWKTLLFGILALIGIPLAAILIAITIIGIPITLIIILSYVILLSLSKIFTMLYVGKLFFEKPEKNLVKAMALGVLIYLILVNIQFLSGFVKILATLLGLGSITLLFVDRKKKSIKKKAKKRK